MGTYPLIFHSPHLSQEIPSWEMDQFLMPPLELKQAIEDVHDVGTDFIQSCRESLLRGAITPAVVFLYSRYLVDVERFEDEAIHEQCFIVDCHSYPVVPFPFEDAEACRPTLCIGADDFHTPPEIVDLMNVERLLEVIK